MNISSNNNHNCAFNASIYDANRITGMRFQNAQFARTKPDTMRRRDVVKKSSRAPLCVISAVLMRYSARVICLVKSMTKEHLPTSSNLSYERMIFEADRGCAPAFVSGRVSCGFRDQMNTCLPARRPSCSADRSANTVKKPCPCTPSLKKNPHSADRTGRNS